MLTAGHAALMGLSYSFLMAFGLFLLADMWGWSRSWHKLPIITAGAWLAFFIVSYPDDPGGIPAWLTYTEIAARYSLAFPGALMSSVALFLQRDEVRDVDLPFLGRCLTGASFAFALYALAGGLVVPPAPFAPASIVNTSLLLQWGLPVQFLRTAAAVIAACCIIRTLDLYEIENRRRLEELRRRELVWR